MQCCYETLCFLELSNKMAKKPQREQKVIGPTTAFSFFGSRIKGIECILQMRPAGTHQDDFAIFETRIPTTSRYFGNRIYPS